MKETNRARQPAARQALVERWTVERLDRDAGMVRIESVPIKSDRLSREVLEMLSDKRLEVGMDRLSLWDIGRARILRMSIESLADKLSLRSNEIETLSENMVFWVLHPPSDAETERVFHATRAARQAAKEIYLKVSRREGASHERK